MKILKHFRKIIVHKHYVFFFARKLGIYWQGFCHDLSKFTPVEFFESARHYAGDRSPIDVCKEKHGYSLAWQFHKGRNPHHYEFWQDNFDKGTTQIRMPDKYVKEMICDYLAAGRAYKGKDFDFHSEWLWWLNKNKNHIAMHPSTWVVVNQVLRELDTLYGTKKITELKKEDWIKFHNIVEIALQCVEE